MTRLPSPETNTPNISRRSFIKKSSITFFANTITYNHVRAQISPAEKLLSVLNNRQSAVSIGLVIFDDIGYSIQSIKLLDLVLNDLNLTFVDLNLISKIDLSQLLLQQNAIDFDLDRIVIAEGWRLGLTEARLCALAAQYN